MHEKVNKTHTGPAESTEPGSAPAFADAFGEALKLYFEAWEKSTSFFRSPGATGSESEDPASMKSTQHTWGTLFAFQEICSDIAMQLSATGLTQGAANMITATFKEEFQKFLNIPALGITRFYQERMNKTMEAYASFQSSLSDFFQLLRIPLEEASDAFQEEMSQAVRYGRDNVHDHQELYRRWIEKLEKYYMSLLKSQRYTEALGKTLSSLCEYRKAREQFLLDILKEWPIATTQDVDEISKDLYLLKKRVKKLEKGKTQ